MIYKLVFFLAVSFSISAQNWPTFGGGNGRTGLSTMAGPTHVFSPTWSVNSSLPTTLGNAVYTFGDRFVTSRITFSPYKGSIECRNLNDGKLVWTSAFISNTAIMYCIGFTKDAVYANDYATGEIYALNIHDGSIKWKYDRKTTTFGGYPGCVFACNGDPILAGKSEESHFTIRLDKHNGKLKWFNKLVIAVTPNFGLACTQTTVYRLTGGITIPIKLTAIDIETGMTKYSSNPIPGDGDQENPICLGVNGEIYFWRDGGKLYAFKDDGNTLTEIWSYLPPQVSGAALKGNISIDSDNNLYTFENEDIIKIDHSTGAIIARATIGNISLASISIDNNYNVFINNGTGKFFAYDSNLKTLLWTLDASSNNYCNPSIGKENIMVITQGGSKISAYQNRNGTHSIPDFIATKYQIKEGESVDFTDQSTGKPNIWKWNFEGSETSSSFIQHPKGIKYNKSGTYAVSLEVSNALGMGSVTLNCFIEVIPATNNIYDLIDPIISIHPTISSNIIFLNSDKSLAGKNYSVIDILGNRVVRGSFFNEENSIEIYNLQDGVYRIIIDGIYFKGNHFIKI